MADPVGIDAAYGIAIYLTVAILCLSTMYIFVRRVQDHQRQKSAVHWEGKTP